MVFNSSNYLDFGQIFVQELAGGFMLFIAIGWIVLWMTLAKNNVPFEASIVVFVLFLLVSSIYNPFFYVLIVAVIGFFFYYMLSRLMNRG